MPTGSQKLMQLTYKPQTSDFVETSQDTFPYCQQKYRVQELSLAVTWLWVAQSSQGQP